MQPNATEIRVLGCLIEKQRTTPDAYPLSLNALRLACNQSTNRDPVVDYDEAQVREALGSLGRRRWIRSSSGHGGRALKYRHLLADELRLPPEQLSLLAILMLRGAQTPGELKQRTERLHPFADLTAVNGTLEQLMARDLVVRLPRRPGQKEERYEQRLGGGPEEEAAEEEFSGASTGPDGVTAAERLARIEEEVTALRAELEALREQLGGA